MAVKKITHNEQDIDILGKVFTLKEMPGKTMEKYISLRLGMITPGTTVLTGRKPPNDILKLISAIIDKHYHPEAAPINSDLIDIIDEIVKLLACEVKDEELLAARDEMKANKYSLIRLLLTGDHTDTSISDTYIENLTHRMINEVIEVQDELNNMKQYEKNLETILATVAS